jgi:UDP-GlcNAc3NAcA epimerase
MPEEINRILTDHLSSLLFCPTQQAIRNLANESITEGVFLTGDVMYDAALTFGKVAEEKSKILSTLGLQPKMFKLCTVHRAENTNNPERLTQIILALVEIASPECPVILPLHPRTKAYLSHYNLNVTINSNPSLRLIEPVDYLDMIMLEKNAAAILTDSGGIQKEAYFFRTPCITLREETEWTETVDAGWNQIAGFKTEKIVECLANDLVKSEIDDFGDGHAAEKIVNAIVFSI